MCVSLSLRSRSSVQKSCRRRLKAASWGEGEEIEGSEDRRWGARAEGQNSARRRAGSRARIPHPPRSNQAQTEESLERCATLVASVTIESARARGGERALVSTTRSFEARGGHWRFRPPRPRRGISGVQDRGRPLGVESSGWRARASNSPLSASLSLSVSPHLRVWVGVGYFSAQPSLRGRIPASDSGNPTLAPWRGRDGTVRDEGTCLRVAARRAALASLLGGEGVPLPCGFPATLPSAEGVCFLRDRPQRVAGIRSARADWWRECLGPGGTPPEGERSSSMLKARLGGHTACFARNFERRRRA